jgi:hypothetical protein
MHISAVDKHSPFQKIKGLEEHTLLLLSQKRELQKLSFSYNFPSIYTTKLNKNI